MSYSLIIPFVAFGLCLVLAVLVIQRNYRSSSHRLFFLFLLGMALWSILAFGIRSSPSPEHAFTWNKAIPITVVMASVTFLHFSFLYTRLKPRKWLLPGIYLELGILIVLSPTNLIIEGIGIDAYGYFPIIGPLTYLVTLSAYSFFILGVANFIKKYRVSTFYEERNSYLYIITGVGCFLLGGISDLLSIFGMPIPPLALVGNILFSLLSSIALLKYHLLDIHIIARKGVAYLLMSATVAIPYVGIILLFNHLFGTGNIPFWVHFILLLLLAFVLQILWRGGQRFVDRWFYRERYDFLRELEDFSQETHDISDLNQLGSSLVKLIGQALQTSSVHLLLLSESGDFNIVSSTGKNTTHLTLESHSPLIRWLQINKGLLYQRDMDVVPQLQSLTLKEKNEIKNAEAELFVPLKTNRDELVGLLVLGKKLSQQPYSQEDRRLILTVASQVAIELENARLYALETMMRRELQRQGEQKTEFLHSVAHELKTPLTAIISSSELLSTELSSTAPRQRLIRNINRSAWLMNKRISELLDLAKTQIGGLELKLEPLKIGVIIEEVTSHLLPLFKSKEQSLKLEIPDSLPQVEADREKLEQILLNLLSNANKFSPTDSNIAVRAREVDDRIVVEVKDSAPAITEEGKEKLFDPYYRGGNADERQRIPGLGLGLAISKKLVELHHGKIWVENEPGKGNTFAFSLSIQNQGEGE